MRVWAESRMTACIIDYIHYSTTSTIHSHEYIFRHQFASHRPDSEKRKRVENYEMKTISIVRLFFRETFFFCSIPNAAHRPSQLFTVHLCLAFVLRMVMDWNDYDITRKTNKRIEFKNETMRNKKNPIEAIVVGNDSNAVRYCAKMIA